MRRQTVEARGTSDAEGPFATWTPKDGNAYSWKETVPTMNRVRGSVASSGRALMVYPAGVNGPPMVRWSDSPLAERD